MERQALRRAAAARFAERQDAPKRYVQYTPRGVIRQVTARPFGEWPSAAIATRRGLRHLQDFPPIFGILAPHKSPDMRPLPHRWLLRLLTWAGRWHRLRLALSQAYGPLVPYRAAFRRMGVIALLAYYWWGLLPSPLIDRPLSTVMDSADGTLLGARIASDGQWRFPATDSLPKRFEACLVAFEDRRFYQHPGIDPIGIGRAIFQNIRAQRIVSGGSTLTMQLARLAHDQPSRSVLQKLKEMLWATRIELRYSKVEILRLYAQHAPFGGNVVGLEAAAWRYYGKSPQLLSWGEAATLAVLPNAPALIHPGRNRDALYAKRDRLLDRLLASGHVDTLTYDLAKAEPLPDAPLPLPRLAPHLLERARWSSPQSPARIATTIDAPLQRFVTHVAQSHQQRLAGNGIHNLAILVADNETGEVRAYIGNAGDLSATEHGVQVDVITAPRSSGSILKPLLYALQLQEGQLLPSQLLPDVPMQLRDYRPENYFKTHDGLVRADVALARSLNIPAVHQLQRYGLEKFHFYLRQLGLTTIRHTPEHYGLPLILGGAEVTLWDLAGVYSSMARTLLHGYDYDGQYATSDFRPLHYRPQPLPEVSRQQLRPEPSHLSRGAIWHTFQAMLKVERPTEEGAWELYDSKRRIAWKTGTSFGFRDAWAVGVSPRYTVGVWVGNADGEGRPGLVGVLAAAPVLFDVFNYLDDPTWFDEPFDEWSPLRICRTSGYQAKAFCPVIDTVMLPTVSRQSESCPFHQMVHLSPDQQYQVHSQCAAPSTMIHTPWFILPPVQAHYYQLTHPGYLPPPPYRSDCLAAISDRPKQLDLIYPKGIAKVYLPRALDGQLHQMVLRAAHQSPQAVIHWHLDDVYMGATQEFHELAVRPSTGEHKVTLVDATGQVLERRFEVLARE